MGVLNVTPDSFSDGSNLGETTSASGFIVSINKVLARAREMIEQGARFLDIGGESTRPGAEPVSHQEELERVIPAIEAIRANFDVFISVDTSSPVVMSAALQAGAVMVNDVRALRRDGALDLVSKSGAAACLMHMQGEPKTMQEQVTYKSVVDEVMHFLAQRIHAAEQAGIARERLVIDPGFGFGKSSQHNYSLLGNLARLQVLGLPVLVGISRKSMIGQATGRAVEQRLAGGVAATACALQGGAKIIRSHDVAATVDAIRVHCALREAWTQETE
jgi:dihydropteroate synthase